MEIINFERDKIDNIEIEDDFVTIYFTNGDSKGRTYPFNAFSVSERIFLVNWFEEKGY